MKLSTKAARTLTVPTIAAAVRACAFRLAETSVGALRLMHTVQRRARFVARFIYWSWQHGSTKHAAWVCAMEGFFW